jgi:hypothetical protein
VIDGETRLKDKASPIEELYKYLLSFPIENG